MVNSTKYKVRSVVRVGCVAARGCDVMGGGSKWRYEEGDGGKEEFLLNSTIEISGFGIN